VTRAARTRAATLTLLTAVTGAAVTVVACSRQEPAATWTNAPATSPAQPSQLAEDYSVVELDHPARTQIRRRADQTVVATLTVGARTAVLTGPERRFEEPSTTAAVIDSTSWVRLLPRPWRQGDDTEDWFVRWLHDQVGATGPPDVLAASMQYLEGEPDRRDKRGVRYAGDAGFGYVHSRDERDGADFYDYLEIPWDFPDAGIKRPAKRWRGELDCSGFIRLVYGYRFGVRLLNQTATTTVDGLPRTAASMAVYARSVVVAAGRNPSRPPTDLSAVQPGDLVFFALHDDPALITHSGIYLGADTDGRMRFISSRGTVDGPTFGDVRGDGVIDSGYFGDRLRRVIRL
jgi:cell wall-associated NlpC family hydrolase